MFQWVMNFRNCSSYTQQAHIVHHLYPRGNPKSERPVMRSNRPLQRCTTGPRSVVKSLVTQEQTPITGRRCCHTSSTVYRFGGNERHRQRPGDDGFASHNKPFPPSCSAFPGVLRPKQGKTEQTCNEMRGTQCKSSTRDSNRCSQQNKTNQLTITGYGAGSGIETTVQQKPQLRRIASPMMDVFPPLST